MDGTSPSRGPAGKAPAGRLQGSLPSHGLSDYAMLVTTPREQGRHRAGASSRRWQGRTQRWQAGPAGRVPRWLRHPLPHAPTALHLPSGTSRRGEGRKTRRGRAGAQASTRPRGAPTWFTWLVRRATRRSRPPASSPRPPGRTRTASCETGRATTVRALGDRKTTPLTGASELE